MKLIKRWLARLMALPIRSINPVSPDRFDAPPLRAGRRAGINPPGQGRVVRTTLLAAVMASHLSGIVLSPTLEAYMAVHAGGGVFAVSQAAYRWFEDGIETGALAIANNGTVRYLPCQAAAAVYATTADNDAIVGDIEIVGLTAPWKFSDSQLKAFASHAGGANNLGWLNQWTTTGALNFAWSPTGVSFSGSNSATLAEFAAAGFTLVDGHPIWTKVTVDVDKGGTQHELKFLAAEWNGVDTVEPDSSQFRLVKTSTNGGTTSIFNTSGAFNISGYNAGSQLMDGAILRVIVRDGIGGTKKYDFNPHGDAADGATSVTSSTTGETYTLTGSVNAPAALSTAFTRSTSKSFRIGLRIRFQETGGKSGSSGDSYQLQSNIAAAGFNNVPSSAAGLIYIDSVTLVAGNATTNRLGSGSGSFVAGKISETGVTTMALTASNYTEILYVLAVDISQLAIGSTAITFRTLYNGATMTYTVTPTITITKGVKFFVQSNTGSEAAAGTQLRAITKGLTGSEAPSGVPVRLTSKLFAGSQAPAGALVASRLRFSENAGSEAAAGALIRSTTKNVAGSETPAGAIVRATTKAVAGSEAASGALARSTSKSFAGSEAAAGALARVTAKLFAGTETAVGVVARAIGKLIGGSQAPSADVARVVEKGVGGSEDLSGSLSPMQGRALQGSIAPVGIVRKAVARGIGGSIAAIGAAVRRVFQLFGGSIAPTNDLQTEVIAPPVVVYPTAFSVRWIEVDRQPVARLALEDIFAASPALEPELLGVTAAPTLGELHVAPQLLNALRADPVAYAIAPEVN